MALVKCPECGREKVSDNAEACPDCGYAIKAYYDKVKQEEGCMGTCCVCNTGYCYFVWNICK